MSMRRVMIDLRRDDVAGSVPVAGHVQCVPTRRRDDAESDAIRLPAGFTAPLVDGQVEVLLEPTGPDWCWLIAERVSGGIVRHVLVPEGDPELVLAYRDLVDVDPATLEPAESAVPAWDAVVAIVGGYASDAAGSASAAHTSKTEAAEHASDAGEFAGGAGAAEQAAGTYADAAQGSANAAAQSATFADASKTEAGVAAGRAEAARDQTEEISGLTGEDGAVAHLIGDEGSETRGALDAAYAPSSLAMEPLPLTNISITPRGTDPIPIGFFDGHIYGSDGGAIKASANSGETWELVATITEVTGASRIQRILPTMDGEVLVATVDVVYRSTGWGEAPTWTPVLTNPNPGVSYIYPWAFDGDNGKFIAAHYGGSTPSEAGPQDRTVSRYGWISTDDGHTWQAKWDTEEMFGGPEQSNLTHIHGACYDPWEDRFLLAEGHDWMTGVYESRDDGETWEKIPYGQSFDSPTGPGNSPTTLVATEYGIVMGTDDPTNGVCVQPRGSVTIERAWSRMGISNTTLLGYAHMGARDPRTGIVYNVYEVNQSVASDLGAAISGSDGQVAGEVAVLTDPSQRLWRRVIIDDKGGLLAWEQSQNVLLRASVPSNPGSKPAHLLDTGRVLGGKVTGQRGALAVGAESSVTGGVRGTAMGQGATVTGPGHNGTAIGVGASSTSGGQAFGNSATAAAYGTAVGSGAYAPNGTAIGINAHAPRQDNLAVGNNARTATDAGVAVIHAVAVGPNAKVSGAQHSVAFGSAAIASGERATAIGSGASATLGRGTAIGQNAKAQGGLRATALGADADAGHADSVALGAATTTTGSSQVAIGARHVEFVGGDRVVAVPAADALRLFARTVDGKVQLVVKFPGGAEVVIAQQP